MGMLIQGQDAAVLYQAIQSRYGAVTANTIQQYGSTLRESVPLAGDENYSPLDNPNYTTGYTLEGMAQFLTQSTDPLGTQSQRVRDAVANQPLTAGGFNQLARIMDQTTGMDEVLGFNRATTPAYEQLLPIITGTETQAEAATEFDSRVNRLELNRSEGTAEDGNLTWEEVGDANGGSTPARASEVMAAFIGPDVVYDGTMGYYSPQASEAAGDLVNANFTYPAGWAFQRIGEQVFGE
ncbi:MAG: hypothetical protein SFZ03_09760 [Candidatus Melainabacteria bacterium]|nr:hypothetical protein [Candidatus Melainabacteria bacterium]